MSTVDGVGSTVVAMATVLRFATDGCAVGSGCDGKPSFSLWTWGCFGPTAECLARMLVVVVFGTLFACFPSDCFAVPLSIFLLVLTGNWFGNFNRVFRYCTPAIDAAVAADDSAIVDVVVVAAAVTVSSPFIFTGLLLFCSSASIRRTFPLISQFPGSISCNGCLSTSSLAVCPSAATVAAGAAPFATTVGAVVVPSIVVTGCLPIATVSILIGEAAAVRDSDGAVQSDNAPWRQFSLKHAIDGGLETLLGIIWFNDYSIHLCFSYSFFYLIFFSCSFCCIATIHFFSLSLSLSSSFSVVSCCSHVSLGWRWRDKDPGGMTFLSLPYIMYNPITSSRII